MDLFADALQQGIAPAIVVAIYLVITKIIDSKRESEKTQVSAMLTQSVNTISEFVVNITKNIIEKDKDKCKNAVEDSMTSSAFRIVQFVSNTILNNNIKANKKNILENIHNIVNHEFYSVYSVLSTYVINGTRISDLLDKQWMKDVEQDITETIYNPDFTNEMKVITFVSKINLRFQAYTTFIINNGIK